MELISDDIFSLYKEAYGEEITEEFAAYMYHISHLEEMFSESEKSEKLNEAILEEIKFVKSVPEIVEKLPGEIEKCDKRMGRDNRQSDIVYGEYDGYDYSSVEEMSLEEQLCFMRRALKSAISLSIKHKSDYFEKKISEIQLRIEQLEKQLEKES